MAAQRTLLLSLCAAALCAHGSALAAELDPATGRLRSTAPGAILVGFEDAAQLATLGVTLTKYSGMGFAATLAYAQSGGPAMTTADLTAHAASEPAVEGAAALLLGAGPADRATGILIPGAKLSPLLRKPKLQLTAWVRSYGATPLLTVTYGTGTLPQTGGLASVTAIRTGRETSDGWTELSTGPIDAAIWGVPIAQVTLGLSAGDGRRNANAALVVDALEIVPLDGTPLPATACTIATQDAACGPDGECQFGHCLPAYASWGPTPPAEHRAAFLDRWTSIAKHTQAARNAMSNADAMGLARAGLSAEGVGARQFYAGMNALVNGLRNHHTSMGSPANQGLLQPLAVGSSSSTLGACAGAGDLDLLNDAGATAPKLGFIFYRVAASSIVGTPLRVGDAITAIDGLDPLTWVKRVFVTYSSNVPADPGADLAWAAPSVAWMISHRASTVEITRCTSATDCSGASKSVLQIDVAGPAWSHLQGTGQLGNENDPNLLDCGQRFTDALTNLPTNAQEDVFASQTIWGDVVGVEFDGTLADFVNWEAAVIAAFPAATPPTKVLFDVREGNGGYAENAEIIAEMIRARSEPIGEVGLGAGAWDGSATVSNVLSILATANPACEFATRTRASAPCDLVEDVYFLGDYFAQVGFEQSQVDPSRPLQSFTPAGTGAKVAWLQSANVSANDYLAALVQGRSNQRVFGPGPTSGSYGTISSTPALLLGWRGGSVQMTDSIWGTSMGALASQSFHSGVGIQPDVVVTQKMSDAIRGVDTMLAAAQTWLAAPGTP